MVYNLLHLPLHPVVLGELLVCNNIRAVRLHFSRESHLQGLDTHLVRGHRERENVRSVMRARDREWVEERKNEQWSWWQELEVCLVPLSVFTDARCHCSLRPDGINSPFSPEQLWKWGNGEAGGGGEDFSEKLLRASWLHGIILAQGRCQQLAREASHPCIDHKQLTSGQLHHAHEYTQVKVPQSTRPHRHLFMDVVYDVCKKLSLRCFTGGLMYEVPLYCRVGWRVMGCVMYKLTSVVTCVSCS